MRQAVYSHFFARESILARRCFSRFRPARQSVSQFGGSGDVVAIGLAKEMVVVTRFEHFRLGRNQDRIRRIGRAELLPTRFLWLSLAMCANFLRRGRIWLLTTPNDTDDAGQLTKYQHQKRNVGKQQHSFFSIVRGSRLHNTGGLLPLAAVGSGSPSSWTQAGANTLPMAEHPSSAQSFLGANFSALRSHRPVCRTDAPFGGADTPKVHQSFARFNHAFDILKLCQLIFLTA